MSLVQTIVLGQVRNKQTRKPLSGAKVVVSIRNTGESSFVKKGTADSDADGNFVYAYKTPDFPEKFMLGISHGCGTKSITVRGTINLKKGNGAKRFFNKFKSSKLLAAIEKALIERGYTVAGGFLKLFKMVKMASTDFVFYVGGKAPIDYPCSKQLSGAKFQSIIPAGYFYAVSEGKLVALGKNIKTVNSQARNFSRSKMINVLKKETPLKKPASRTKR